MNRFWDSVIKPCLEMTASKNIVEIGADKGDGTKKIIAYCKENSGNAISIDPFPQFDYKDWEKNSEGTFTLYTELSVSRLPLLKNYDAILIDGDHNWYTVYSELLIIQETFHGNMPLVFLHDIGWPYDRRDMYYTPSNIPEYFRQPYEMNGVHPSTTSLVEKDGMNHELFNSIYANTPRNGVLTAIEDFLIHANNKNLKLIQIPIYHSLGILIDIDKFSNVKGFLDNKDVYINLMSEVEKDRILKHIEFEKLIRDSTIIN